MLMDQDEWLTLSQAAGLLGVHPSTVRLWSDKGRIPVHRTRGNHRRYRRSEVELWSRTAQPMHAPGPENIVQFALSRIRFKVGEGQLEAESWYARLDEPAREQYRQSGRVLVQGLANFLSAKGPGAIAEAHSLGYEYASRGRRFNLDSLEAARAFLFFRNALLESMIAVYQEAGIPSGAAWGEMLNRTLAFTDQVLVTLLETYRALEEARP
ncbi:MAG TPA: helix-turn-helix domain-containing protein [Anaerolineales bacterium]|nr:helix-turn-helix domain-containing protein [Anaerolineales bacterium]